VENACVIQGIEFKYGGFNTLVRCDRDQGRAFKVITGKRGHSSTINAHSFQLNSELARNLVEMLNNYVSGLSQFVRIPNSSISIITNNNSTMIWIDQPYIGKDLGVLLESLTVGEVREIVKLIKNEYVDALTCETNIRPDGFLAIGADLKAPNFCLDEEGKLVLVDIFPPLVWINGKAIVEMFDVPEDVYRINLWKLYSKEGMICNALSQLGRARIDCWEIYKKELGFDVDLWNSDISSLSEKDTYKFRLLACEFAFKNRLPDQALKNFFDLTHFEALAAPEQVENFKKTLAEMKGEVGNADNIL
jgi:hypothetical protein